MGTLTAALAADAAGLAPYGLEATDAVTLDKEIKDYEQIIASPQSAIAGRKALTKILRPRFREVSELLAGMDRLVSRFRKTEAGRRFVDTWTAARIVRDLGRGSGTTPEPTPAA